MNKRYKILHIFSRYLQYGGEEAMFHTIGDELRKRHQVDDFIISSADMLKGSLLHKVLLPLRMVKNKVVMEQLRELQDKHQYDFWQIHNVFPAISPSAYEVAFEMGVPVVHYLHNYRFGCLNSFLFSNGKEYRAGLKGNFLSSIWQGVWQGSRIKSALMAFAIMRARKIGVFKKITRWIAISHAQKAIHVEMGIPADRIDVVHHFKDHESSESLTALPENGKVLFMGRLSPEKGGMQLLQAWSRIQTERRLMIVGDGPEYAVMKDFMDSQKISNVDLMGFVPKEKHSEIWAQTSFMVVPSIWQETFGMVVLEAWANGRPVVAHAIGALPEMIKHGTNGFLVAANNIQNMQEQLEDCLKLSSSELQLLAKHGMQQLDDYFCKPRWNQELEAIYDRIDLKNV